MAYITISIILLILFLDVGLQIEHNNNTKIYLLISSLKIKLNLKSFDRFIEEASHKTSKENVDNFKKNLSLVKPIKHIMAYLVNSVFYFDDELMFFFIILILSVLMILQILS